VATPSVDSGLVDDVYLAAAGSLTAGPHATATLNVFVQPLVLWLWVGAGLIGGGALLAAVPGRRRRRPTDPSTVPLPELVGAAPPAGAGVRS
jgi:cytochrome c-type biogenesis protein CcmF